MNNLFPSVDYSNRIAIIDFCPSPDDIQNNSPFFGKAGNVIKAAFNRNGHSPLGCFMGYVCSFYVPANKKGVRIVDNTSSGYQISKAALRRELELFKPNIVLLLGAEALHAAGKQFSIANYHGTLFLCTDPSSPFYGYKCTSTYHPDVIGTDYPMLAFIMRDVERCIRHSHTIELITDEPMLDLTCTLHNVLGNINLMQSGCAYAIDIEGGSSTGITCISVARDRHNAFIVPFDFFSVEETVQIILALKSKLEDPTIRYILQNALYDTFHLYHCFKIVVRNVHWDTMLSSWELYCELPKALDVQTSFWTDVPYYKYQRTIEDKLTHYAYCCRDSCVTYEIAECHAALMTPTMIEHFQLNMCMLYLANYFQIRGIAYNALAASNKLAELRVILAELSRRITTRAGRPINVNSPAQLSKLLYVDNALPKQHPPSKTGRGLDKSKTTTDVKALLKLSILRPIPLLDEILLYRNIEKTCQTLEKGHDPDLRMRCGYSVVGTDTGRFACYKSPTGSGDNLQTITKHLRYLFTADPNKHFFQADLAGADGWTVAAHCQRLGDSTMMEDYMYGIKPARVIGLMFTEGEAVSRMPRAELHARSKAIGSGDTEWLYFTCKRVQHGTNYLLGIDTMIDQIMKDSYKINGKPLRVDAKICRRLQQLYLLRYKGVKYWQNDVQKTVVATGKLTNASGHIRRFFDPLHHHGTFRKACAQEPQHNTTYAIKLALRYFLTSPDNRTADGRFRVEPLHMVHDSINGQFDIADEAFATAFIRRAFNNTITIAGYPIVIPFEGTYGPNWYNQPHEI